MVAPYILPVIPVVPVVIFAILQYLNYKVDLSGFFVRAGGYLPQRAEPVLCGRDFAAACGISGNFILIDLGGSVYGCVLAQLLGITAR